MPTYEYHCRRCGHRFSLFQSITAKPVKDCPKCKSRGSVERLISGGAGLIFKGSGFYITDYKQKPAPTGEKSSEGTRKGSDDKKG
ncbi:MAG: zinc ribbon domain-containing protein [candidate division WOR-3 bacterium]